MRGQRIIRNVPTSGQKAGGTSCLLPLLFLPGIGFAILFIVFSGIPARRVADGNRTALAAPPAPTSLPQALTPIIPSAGSLNGLSGPLVGQTALDFTLPTLDGQQVTLSDFRGKAVLINFWASWCIPCRSEVPELIKAYANYRDQGLVILGLNATEQDILDDAKAFIEEFDIPFPILLDKEGLVTNDDYRLLGFPMSVFVDRNGIIRHVHLGAMTGEQIARYVQPLLQDEHK